MALFQEVQEYGFLGGVGGSCVFCNASKRTTDRPERIITTNLVTDAPEVPEGVWPEKYLEVCETCINEMGQLVGMETENQVLHTQRILEQMIEERESIEKELAAAKSDLESLEKALSYIRRQDSAKPVAGPSAKR